MTTTTPNRITLPAIGLCFLAILCATAWPSAADSNIPPLRTHEYALQPDGLIANWLALGYLPGRADEDRLAAVGGETNITAYGGQTVMLPGSGANGGDLELTWKTIDARKIEIPYYMYAGDGLTLFIDNVGHPVEDATAYLYCELRSPSARELILQLTGGEPLTIWLNGEELPVTGRRGHLPAGVRIPVTLTQGINRLLIRQRNGRHDAFLAPKLVNKNGKPPQDVRVLVKAIKDAPFMPERYLAQDWQALIDEIPSVPPSLDEASFGANLSRTMALLESGAHTRRPVRILFYGQSITAQEWVWMLVRQLRARYPGTIIEAENFAIGGWGIDRLNRTIKHDVLHARPDLVVLHAYHGGSWSWERIIQKIRRETTADIMIRTAHISRHEQDEPIPLENSESILLRRLARKYGCEMVECRQEWIAYTRAHDDISPEDLRSDAVHLSRKGSVLMAQLYERHFRRFPTWSPWLKTVRWYDAMRPLADHKQDEVRLLGDGWDMRSVNSVRSTGANDRLTLTFRGNRVDLVMPQCAGSARILIDGKTPSEWNFFHGTRPGWSPEYPAGLMTYHMGTNMVEETWTLTFTQVSGDRKRFRYTVTGSETGLDGEGGNDEIFVSNSGRITILPTDFLPNRSGADKDKTELEPAATDWRLRWHVKPLFSDIVQGTLATRGEEWMPRFNHPYRYRTIIDGLPPGEHELTLIPIQPQNPNNWFGITAVEVHRPPLWGD